MFLSSFSNKGSSDFQFSSPTSNRITVKIYLFYPKLQESYTVFFNTSFRTYVTAKRNIQSQWILFSGFIFHTCRFWEFSSPVPYTQLPLLFVIVFYKIRGILHQYLQSPATASLDFNDNVSLFIWLIFWKEIPCYKCDICFVHLLCVVFCLSRTES
jgi:hypothetical protein